MFSYIVRRLLLMIPTVLGITIVVFVTMRLSPGDPIQNLLDAEGGMKPEEREALLADYNERWGICDPLWKQYLRWLNNASPVGFEPRELTAEELAKLQAKEAADHAESEADAQGEPAKPDPYARPKTKMHWVGFKKPNLGRSQLRDRPVYDVVAEALPITLLLNAITIPLVYAIAVTAGIYAARHRGGLFDISSGVVFLGLWSLPVMWVGVMLIGVFANRDALQWFPTDGLHDDTAASMPFLPRFESFGQFLSFLGWCVAYGIMRLCQVVALPVLAIWLVYLIISITLRYARGEDRKWGRFAYWGGALVVVGIAYFACISLLHFDVVGTETPWQTRGYLLDWMWHLVLPIICLTYGGFAFLSKLMRGAMLENLAADFVRTARAKGASENVVLFRHVLRNSLIPLITTAAGILPGLLGGSLIVEAIFSINGMGNLMIQAIGQRDQELVLSVTLVISIISTLSLLLADVLYAVVDPRVSYE